MSLYVNNNNIIIFMNTKVYVNKIKLESNAYSQITIVSLKFKYTDDVPR